MRFLRSCFSALGLLALMAPSDGMTQNTYTERLPLYSSSSKLSSGNWKKMRIKKQGVYKITFAELKNLGFSDPAKVRVFGYGGHLLSENLDSDYLDDLPEVYSYVADDCILFYAEGPVEWVYQSRENPFAFSKNPYSDYGYYFLSDVKGNRKDIADDPVVADSATQRLVRHYEYDYYQPEKANPYKTGSMWYDEGMLPSSSRNVSFYFKNMVEGDYGCFSGWFDAPNVSSPGFTVNCSTWTSNSFGTNNAYCCRGVPQDPARGIVFQTKYTASTNASTAYGYIYYLAASALCGNKLDNGYLYFNNIAEVKNEDVCKVVLSNVTSKTQVWNVTDRINVLKVKTEISGDSLTFNTYGKKYSSYVAFDPSSNAFLAVDSFYTVQNQDLHGFRGADLIIISPASYRTQASRLADLHAQADGLSSYIVTQEQIFNEFSSGTPDPTAIRSFMKMLYDRALNDESYVQPRYLLLFGDGCYDNKGVLRNSSSEAHNLVLTYQTGNRSNSFVTDDYYGFLSDNTNRAFSLSTSPYNVAVGRLPFCTPKQADDVVGKIERYMKNDQLGDWKAKACIIADDNEAKILYSTYHEFLFYAENISRLISRNAPGVLQKKIYLDSYNRVVESSGNRYPEIEKLILDNISDGTMFINYIGHSNPINWSAEKIFTQSLVSGLSNKRLGVWFSASCEFSEFDSYSTSCGEALTLAPNGGAIAVIATPRMVYATENNMVNVALVESFYSQTEDMLLGDIMLKAKNKVSNDIRSKFVLLGDPAVRIFYPPLDVVTDSISSDTVNALSHVAVRGHVEEQGRKISSFNGSINIKVFDKMAVRSTKGNNLSKDGEPLVATFEDYPNVLFSGEAEVHDGEFEFSFITPMDISYNYGNGRIAYYAYDVENKTDAIGCYKSFVVGGSLDSVIVDEQGPDALVYVNSSSFRSGDVVGSNPVLIAEVSDMNGINASDIGIGHNITVSVNGSDPESVNEYFSYTLGSCTEGKVVYPIGELEDGVYNVTFKVWDLLNNSSTKTVSFKVENGKPLHVDNMMAISNPASEEATVRVSYDRPLADVSYKVSVSDINGHIINQLSGSDNSRDGVLDIVWDLKDNAGRRVRPGVYVYRVDLKTSDCSYVGNSEKIIVFPK